MKRNAVLSIAASFLAVSTASAGFAQDTGDSKPYRQSDDPSYEPSRDAARSNPRPSKSRPANNSDIVSDPAPSTPVSPARITITENPPGPRVKYILDGKPVYSGEVPVAEPLRREPPAARLQIETSEPYDRRAPSYDPPSRAAEIEKPAPVARSAPTQTQTFRTAGRGGAGTWERSAPATSGAASASISIESPAYTPPDTNINKRTPFVDPNDLTADKPGSAAAENPSLLEEMPSPGQVNTRATKCYTLLAELKTDVETISRCLDNRGKENARLVHTSDELSKCISDMASIWPNNDEFREQSVTLKRHALLLNDELNQQPWRWAQVRWSFDAVLKSATGYREACRTLAEQEPKPIAIVDKKTGQVRYVDAPDPFMDTPAGKQAAALKADRDEITRRNKLKEMMTNSKNKVKTDLDGN